MVLARSSQTHQLTSANYCLNDVTQWDTTITYITGSSV